MAPEINLKIHFYFYTYHHKIVPLGLNSSPWKYQTSYTTTWNLVVNYKEIKATFIIWTFIHDKIKNCDCLLLYFTILEELKTI